MQRHRCKGASLSLGMMSIVAGGGEQDRAGGWALRLAE